MHFIIDQVKWTFAFLLFINILPANAAHGPVHEQIKQLTKSILKSPDSLLLYLERGMYYQIDEDYKSAILDFEKVLDMDEHTYSVYYPLAEIYFETEDYPQADKCIHTYLLHYPQHANGQSLYAEIQVVLENYDLAIEGFRNTIEIKKEASKPNDFINLARVLKKENPTAAYQVLNDGIDLIGPVITLQDEMIQIATENKWYDKAIQQIDSILLKAKRKEYWLLQKAVVLETQGYRKLAKENYTNCLAEIAGLKPKTKETDFVKAIHLKAELALTHL